jgi:hypothetical protein
LSTAQRFLDGKGFKPAERQAAVAIVATSTQPDAVARRLALLELLVQGRLDASLRLEVHAFALTSAEPAVQAALRRYLTLARQPEALATPDLPFELLIVGGDPKRGRLIANEHLAANCTACHRFESDEGSEVGPTLKAVGALGKAVETETVTDENGNDVEVEVIESAFDKAVASAMRAIAKALKAMPEGITAEQVAAAAALASEAAMLSIAAAAAAPSTATATDTAEAFATASALVTV